MKITTPAGIIECTVDEYEDLVVRGLLPGKEQLIEQNDNDDWLQKLQRINKSRDTPDWMKTVVALYGCETVPPITASNQDQTQFTSNTDNDTLNNKTQLT